MFLHQIQGLSFKKAALYTVLCFYFNFLVFNSVLQVFLRDFLSFFNKQKFWCFRKSVFEQKDRRKVFFFV